MIEVEVFEVDLSSEFLTDYKDMVQRQRDFIKNEQNKRHRNKSKDKEVFSSSAKKVSVSILR